MARRGITIGPGAGIMMGVGFAIGLIAMLFIAQFFGLSMWQPTGGGEKPETPPTTGYALQLPISVTVRDAIAGTPVSGGTLYVLDSDMKVLESVAVDSSGKAVTDAYLTGTELYFFYVSTGYGAAPVLYTVPYAASEAQDYYYARVDVYAFPSDANLTLSLIHI